jgi:hypothetical protein
MNGCERFKRIVWGTMLLSPFTSNVSRRKERGATGFDGDTKVSGAEFLGSRQSSGNMQPPIKNWHSQLHSLRDSST